MSSGIHLTELEKRMSEFCADPEDKHASSAHDLVNHPPHYTMSPYEPNVVAEAIGNGYNRCTALAYLCRAPHKGNMSADLRKAAWYARRLITARESFTPLPEVSARAVAVSWDDTYGVRHSAILSFLTGYDHMRGDGHDQVDCAGIANELEDVAKGEAK